MPSFGMHRQNITHNNITPHFEQMQNSKANKSYRTEKTKKRLEPFGKIQTVQALILYHIIF